MKLFTSVYLLIFILLSVTCGSSIQVEESKAVLIIEALSNTADGNTTIYDAMREGMFAAYYNSAINNITSKEIIIANDRPINNFNDLNSSIASVLNTSEDQPFLMVHGPLGDELLKEAIDSEYITENNIIFFGPFTETSEVRFWNKQTFFIRADPRVELLTLLHYAVNQQAVRRVGFMYISGTNYGSNELALLQTEMKTSFNTTAIVFTQSDQTKLNQTLFDEFISKQPEAIIIFGAKCNATIEFIDKLVTDTSLKNIMILAPYSIQETLLATYQSVIDVSKQPIANPTVISGTNPLPSATEYAHVQQFRKEMKTYIEQAKTSTSTFTDPEIFDKDMILGEAMLSGWIAGSVFMKVFMNDAWTVNRSTFQKGLLDQKRFVIGDDFLLGDYGANCSKAMQDQGFMCECNQGGHTAFLKIVNSNNKLEYIPNSLLPYDSSKCYPTQYIITKSIQLLLMSPQDQQLMNEVGTNMSSILSNIVKESNENGKNSVLYNVKEMKTQTANEVADLSRYYTNYSVDVIFGPLTSDSDANNMCVIDPIYEPLQSHRTETNLIHIMPTVEQQIYTLYEFVTNNKGVFPAGHQKVKFILKKLSSTEDAQYRQIIQQTVRALKAPSFDIDSLKDGSIDTLLDKQGVNFVIGATYEDIQPLIYLISNTTCNASVILTYQDFATLYDNITLSTQLKDQSTRRRLFTMSNLPMWTFKPANQNLYSVNSNDNDQKFNNKQNVKANTFTSPREMEMSMLKSFVDEIIKLSSNRVNPNFLNTIYTNGLITTDSMEFGPYVDCSVAPDISSSVSQDVKCENRNYGARDIVIFSYEHVYNTAESTLSNPITPTMNYLLESRTINSSNVIAIVIGIIAAIIIIALIALLIYYVTYARHVKNALKNSDEPLTIVYIDIDGCTELWASEPEVMPHVIATYYHLVREAIEKHWCYEVKLIGDAFMVACKDANSALQLARDVQIKLLLQDWRTDLIDAAYRRFEETKMAEIPGYESPMLMLDPLQYAARWNGIRARIGMHTGLCTIEYHSEMKGFDYTGETVKNAARITSLANGGQTIMSEDTWYALTREEREKFDYNNLETKEIRHIPFSMDIYQLNAIPGRAFPPLRSRAKSIDKCFNNDVGMGLITSDDMATTMPVAGHEGAIASVLADSYSVFPTTRRVQEILPLLDKWRVECPAAPADRGEDVQAHYFRALLSRLASKLAVIRTKRNGFSSNDWAQLQLYQMKMDEVNLLAHEKGEKVGNNDNRNNYKDDKVKNNKDVNNKELNDSEFYEVSNDSLNTESDMKQLFMAARQAQKNRNIIESGQKSVQNSTAALEEVMQVRSNSVSTIEADSMGVEELDRQ